MIIEPHLHGRCEYYTSYRSMCGKRGRWMVNGEILCGEHKKKKVNQHESRRVANFMSRVVRPSNS